MNRPIDTRRFLAVVSRHDADVWAMPAAFYPLAVALLVWPVRSSTRGDCLFGGTLAPFIQGPYAGLLEWISVVIMMQWYAVRGLRVMLVAQRPGVGGSEYAARMPGG